MHGGRKFLFAGALAVAFGVGGVALGRELGAREAREQIAALVGVRPDAVRIKTISPGMIGSEAVVEAQVPLTVRMTENGGSWRVADIRLGENRWENVDTLRRAVDELKGRQATAELRTLADAVEAYRRERGFYPDVDTSAALVDHICPRFLAPVIRVDPWHKPYLYRLDGAGFRVGSCGPDGLEGTGDDLGVDGRKGS